MQGETNETVGETFSGDLLRAARDKTLEVILEAASQIRPGMTEADAKKLIQDIQAAKGAPKSWHPPQIRFGANTVLAFGERGEEQALKADDIFFFDIGPIFDGHEGDVGRPFAIGANPDFQRCCNDAEAIWHEVRNHWKTANVSGEALYAFANEAAQKRGWVLSLKKADGHRVADFPHIARSRGSIKGFSLAPAADRWILEIQIRHPEKQFGAFFEDLLN